MHGTQLWPRFASPIIMRNTLRSVPVGPVGHAAHLVIVCLDVFGCSGCSFTIAGQALHEFLVRPCLCADGVDQAERACACVGALPPAYANHVEEAAGAAPCNK